MQPIRSLLLTLSLLAAAASLAQAHAFLDHADPKVGSQVHGSPASVKIWYTEELEPAFTTVQVFDASGSEVDQKGAKVDAADAKLLTLPLPPLQPGKYKVVWKAVATDTHITHGTFEFEVLP